MRSAGTVVLTALSALTGSVTAWPIPATMTTTGVPSGVATTIRAAVEACASCSLVKNGVARHHQEAAARNTTPRMHAMRIRRLRVRSLRIVDLSAPSGDAHHHLR